MKFHEHPLNKQIGRFEIWLSEKRSEMRLSAAQHDKILGADSEIFNNSGLANAPEATDISVAVFRHMLHAVKSKAVELCPQFARVVKDFDHPDNQKIIDFAVWMTRQVLNGELAGYAGAARHTRRRGCLRGGRWILDIW